MKTFQEYAAANPSEDPLDTIRGYSEDVKLGLLESGEYDDEVADEIDQQLLQHAADQGYVTPDAEGKLDPATVFRKRDDDDLDHVATYAEDPAAREAAARYKLLKEPKTKALYADTPEEYERNLEDAKVAYSSIITPQVRDLAVSDALTYGNTPFAVREDAEGNRRLDISPQMREVAGNDQALAQLFRANPNLDKSLIPLVRSKLRTPDGYTVPEFVLDRQMDFNQAVTPLIAKDPMMARELAELRTAADSGNIENLAPKLDSIRTGLANLGIGDQFSREEQDNFLRDMVIAQSAPKVDETNLDNNLATLSTGEVHVPMGVMLNKPLFERTLKESTKIPEAQKQALAATRDARIEAFANDAFGVIAANRPEFTQFFEDRKLAGATDAAVLDEWMSNPENHSTLKDFAGGTAESIVEGFGGLALYPLAMAGNEDARNVVAGLQKMDSDRRAYAKLFGKNLGAGYDLTRLAAPIAADIGVSLLTAGAASAAVGAKTTAREAIKSTLKSALSSETKSVLGGFTRAAAARQAGGAANLAGRSVGDVVSLAGRDIGQALTKSATTASYLATAFNRSAGSTYVQLYSTLENQKNADGSPKYTSEEAREIALNHGLLAGTLTAAVTGGFSFLGKAGMERIYDGMTRRQLNGVFDRVRRDWGKLDPAVRAGMDISNPDKFLESVIRKSVTPLWQAAGKPIVEEGAEEGLDEFLQYFNQQTATGEKINVTDAVKQAAYASFLGGAIGGTVTGVNSMVRGDTPAPQAEAAVRRQTLLDTARKLDAAASPQTAAIVRRAAFEGIPTAPEEVVPEGTDAGGPEQTPSDASVAAPDALTRMQTELVAQQEELAGLTPVQGETIGAKARRERRTAVARNRIAELEQRIAGYDPNTIEMGVAPERQWGQRAATDPRAGQVTELPSGPTIEMGAAPVNFTSEPGFIVEDIDQMPERDGEPVTRWRAEDGLGSAEGFIDTDGTLVISNIEAKARGTGFLKRVLDQSPSGEIRVPLQSQKMQGALAKLVSEGVLTNPSDPRGVEQYPTRFTVAAPRGTSEILQSSDTSTNPDAKISEEQAAPETPVFGENSTQQTEVQSSEGGADLSTENADFETLIGADLDKVAENLGLKRRGFRDEQLRAQIQKNFTPEQIDAARTFATTIPTEDIFYERGPRDSVDPDDAREIAAILDSGNPVEAVAGRRAQVDAFLKSKGIVTEGLSDQAASQLLEMITKEPGVEIMRGREAPETPTRADMAELEKFGFGTPEFLTNVAKGAKPEYQKVARLLMKFPEIPVTVVDIPGAEFSGTVVSSTGQVLFNQAKAGPRGSLDTVLHEMLHAATYESIENPTPEQAKILKRLDRVRKAVLRKSQENPAMAYALSDVHEMVSHAFTSPEFMKRVSELTPKGEKNWAQVIIDLIRDLLNGRSVSANAKISEELMNLMMDFTDLAAGTWGTSKMDQAIANPGVMESAPPPTLLQQPAGEQDFSYTPAQARSIAESLTPEGVELTIDFNQLADDMEDMAPADAEDLVAAMVNRDVAAPAGEFRPVFDGAITGNPDPTVVADLRADADKRGKWIDYAAAAVDKLWSRLAERWDFRTMAYHDRLNRNLVSARDGYKVRSLMMQPAGGPEFTNFVSVNDGNKLYTSTGEDLTKPGWFGRMFTRRDDLTPSISAIKVDTEAQKNVIQQKFERLNKKYETAIKKESPDMDVLKQAIGSTAPLLTPDEETRINAEVDRRLETASGIAKPLIDQARETRDKALRRATDDDARAAANEAFRKAEDEANSKQTRAYEQAMDWQRDEVDKSMVNHANELRRVQSLAMQQLEMNSPLTWAWANEIRKTTDEFQDLLSNWYKDEKPDLALTIDRSRGVYLVRSYRFHQDPAMAELVLHDPRFEELRERATAFFGENLAKDRAKELSEKPEYKNQSEEVLLQVARQDVEPQARLLFEDYVMGHENFQTQGTSNTLKTEFQRFMHKKNLDPVISEILGEIDDPLFNAGRTLTAVSNILFSQKMLAAVKKDGLANGSIVSKSEKESNSKYRNWVPLVAEDAHSQAYAPLAGFYASPEDKDAWDAAFNASRRNAKDTAGQASEFLNKAILGMAGASLGVVTLSSPGYFTRNILGGILMSAAQGVNLFSPKGAKAIKSSFNKAFKSGGDQEFIEKMIAYRVLGDGAQITYLRDFLKKYRENPTGAMDWAAEKGMKISPEAVETLGKLKKGGWDKMVEFLGNSAEFTETIPNVAIYLNELDALVESGVYATQQEAEQEAARRTKMVTPSKSEASQAVKGFAKNPLSALIAPFLFFKTEMVRTVVNTYRLAFEDLKSDNEVLKTHGAKRLASAAMVHGALTVLMPLVLQKVAGLGDDEDKAIRAAMPSYSKNSSFWYDRNDDGTITTWDLTFANPFSLNFDVLTQLIRASRSRDWSEMPQIIKRFVTEEMLGEQVVAGNILDVNRNIDESTGMPIWLETDDFSDRLTKGAAHIIGGSYTPTIGKKIYQSYMASQRPESDEEESFFFTPLGIMAGSVAPVKPRDHEIEKLAYRSFRNLSKKNSELWILTNPLANPAGMPEGEATEIYNERVKGAVKVWGEAHRLAKAYQKMGLTRKQVLEQMRESGLSKERSIKAINGFTDRPIIDSKKLQQIKAIDPRRHEEIVKAMKRQARVIDLRQ